MACKFSGSFLYKLCAILHNPGMNRAELLFHIARQAGLEFVFTSGNALSYPAHTHVSVYTITVVRKGTVRLTRKDSTDIYPAGSVYIVAPYEPHSPAYEDKFDIVSLCVSKSHFSPFSITSRHSLNASCLEYARRLIERGLLCADTVQSLLAGIDTIYQNTATLDTAHVNPPKILETWECLGTEQTVDEAPAPSSRFHFIRQFKGETGLTPHQYIIQSRIREAKKLLTAEIAIADAAALAGFCDQSHLNRWFKRSLGITPQKYKQSCFFLDASTKNQS